MQGLPYMGSKRKIARHLVDFMLEDSPECKYVYDLFGGGGAMTFEFAKRSQIKKVVYNELNTAIVELLKDIRENGITEKYYQWIDRETFHKHKYDDDWFGGLLSCVWSFGNNQKDYLFSAENEKLKRPLHLAIVNQDGKYLKEFEEITGDKIPFEVLESNDINVRRSKLMQYARLQTIERINRIQTISRIESLSRLSRLSSLSEIVLLNKSYDEVIIDTPIDETIIYLNPPYEDTGKYKKDICHEKLLDWIKSSKYKIYMSSYKSELPEVFSIKKRVLLSASDNSKKANEKL